MSQPHTLRKVSSPRLMLDSNRPRPIKRIHHIKSLPALQTEPLKLYSPSKLSAVAKEEINSKIKRHAKPIPHLKAPVFGAVKTARQRNAQWSKKKDHIRPSLSSKSLSKSTNIRSPREVETADSKRKKTKSKKAYSGLLKRMQQVMEDYQLKIEQLTAEKEWVAKQNKKLKGQLQGRRSKRALR